ncbi:MAG: MFS transporter [Luminiphilus sp.]|jgi:GPH family glycoside/pentoside/hexuronide:cation symporter|nr:MFS transporter [Luminiphilus sp.]MDG1830019.1 MFS transporter [Luminiphilus sp.]MDG2494745.1 MFS transporter [Luminiphilus sp.]
MNREAASTTAIPMSQKIAFGIGMLANQMFPAALSIFIVILVQSLGMSPIMWGLIFFLPKLVDAITDPLMGYISDRTQSRWGKRRPYIFIGAIVAGLSYIAMWQLSEDNSLLFNFWYFLGWNIIFFLGMTIFSVPYVAMGYEMSSDYHERTRLMAVAQWIGQWAWVIAPWFWIALYDPNWFDSATEGARTLSIWVGLICMGLAIVPAVLCRSEDNSQEESEAIGSLSDTLVDLWRGILITLANKPFQKVCIATFCIFNAFNTVAGFAFFIIVYYMNNGDPVQAGNWPALFGSVSAICTCFLVIPVINWMAQKLGKLKTFTITQTLSLTGYSMFWWSFSPENPYLMFVPIPLYVFGIGGLFTLMMSMTADICDMDELETGERREGLFGAIYWWMVKFGAAFAGLLSGLILASVGFDQSVTVQSDSALAGLRAAFILVPVTGTIIGILVMRSYELDETKVNEIRTKLDARGSA